LRQCNSNSLGINKFCNNNDDFTDLSSEFLVQLLQSDFEKRFLKLPYFYKQNFTLNRTLGSKLRAGDVFETTNVDYRGVEKDIAIVQVYFKTAYTTKIERSLTMGWIVYFSNVGGIFGLVLGMGLISLFELLWLSIQYLEQVNLRSWLIKMKIKLLKYFGF
jgi:hypothetical protein